MLKGNSSSRVFCRLDRHLKRIDTSLHEKTDTQYFNILYNSPSLLTINIYPSTCSQFSQNTQGHSANQCKNYSLVKVLVIFLRTQCTHRKVVTGRTSV